jgi:hypothetical protein
VLQLVQKLRDQQPPAAPPATQQPGTTFHLQMNLQERTSGGKTERRIEVRFDARPAQNKPDPAVILIAPPPVYPAQQDKQLLQEALQFNAFTVLSEPVDVNLMLEVMARALRRFHQNQWPV